MSLGIKTKQVFGVTLIVGLAVISLSAWYISSLAAVRLEETRKGAELLANAIWQRAFDVVQSGGDPRESLPADAGLRSILEASLYSNNVLYATIVDRSGLVIAHNDVDRIGKVQTPGAELDELLNQGPVAQVRAIYTEGKSYEFRKPLFIKSAEQGSDTTEFGSVKVGVSTLLLQDELTTQMRTPLITAATAIILALVVAMFLAQVTLRPIHVIRSGLARLGRGELDVNVDFSDLSGDPDFVELGDSFRAVSARLATDRSELAGQRATLESVVETLEDAVALFGPNGALLFANPAMEPVLGVGQGRTIDQLVPAGHPYRVAVELALSRRESADWRTVQVPGGGERLVVAQAVEDDEGRLLGVMLRARNLTELTRLGSMLSYSSKLAALGRLSAGIAHEVKNPLNATMIHLELLKMQLAESPAALEHLAVIANQVRRLDDVVQGFLKFTRPEELQLQPVAVLPLIEELLPVISAEASKSGVDVKLEFPADLPAASGDPGLLQQAFLNLALNACQAMPNGGKLRIAGSVVSTKNQIAVVVEDTGVGIAPEDLARIFDLYFTTKDQGSGIGLSLVYRTIQLLDGEIEVQSVPGRGTTFRVLLRQSPVASRRRATTAGGTLGLHEVTGRAGPELSKP